MFKRLRDYIYDISDVFVALVVIFAAAGVITWRASSLIDYPKYVENNPELKASIELAAEARAARIAESQPEKRVIQTSISIEVDFKGGWGEVADRLVAAKIIKETDRDAFVRKAKELNYADRPLVGVFVLSSDMSFGRIVMELCGGK